MIEAKFKIIEGKPVTTDAVMDRPTDGETDVFYALVAAMEEYFGQKAKLEFMGSMPRSDKPSGN